jgi:enolase
MNDYISSRHVVSRHTGEYISHGLDRAISLDAVRASAILDSRGFPTVKVDLELDDGTILTGSAPAGVSTGRHEAVELRDGGSAFGGKGGERALRGIRVRPRP